MGGIWVLGSEAGLAAEACLAVSEEPVSIWTTCLKEEVSACTKVVGYGFDSDRVMGLGVGGWWSPLLLLLLLLLLLVLWLFGDGTRLGFWFCPSIGLAEFSIMGFSLFLPNWERKKEETKKKVEGGGGERRRKREKALMSEQGMSLWHPGGVFCYFLSVW